MTKKSLIVLGTAILIIAGVLFGTHTKDPLVVVETPQPGDSVMSPLIVTGTAKGPWFFEGSFPVHLLDALGSELAVVPAQAQGDWMSEGYVPFQANLTFNVERAQYGTLIFKKDNPSGLPENDAEFRVAVWLEPSEHPDVMTLKAFFGNRTTQGGECADVSPVTRSIPATTGVARAALEELLKGPTGAEQTAGFFTNIPAGVKIHSLTIKNGTAIVDFSTELEKGVAGSCLVIALRAQIEATLKQFPTVHDVVISIDGRTEDILQP